MTVLPGSLDYLYYNGIIDHIPYEAYEQIYPAKTAVDRSSFPDINLAPEKDVFEKSYKKRNNTQTIMGCASLAIVLSTLTILLCKGCGGVKNAVKNVWTKITPEKWHNLN